MDNAKEVVYCKLYIRLGLGTHIPKNPKRVIIWLYIVFIFDHIS